MPVTPSPRELRQVTAPSFLSQLRDRELLAAYLTQLDQLEIAAILHTT